MPLEESYIHAYIRSLLAPKNPPPPDPSPRRNEWSWLFDGSSPFTKADPVALDRNYKIPSSYDEIRPLPAEPELPVNESWWFKKDKNAPKR